jgi:signal peptidase I
MHTPTRGDVIVFHSPQDEKVDFIKRIIAIPGDTVMVKGGYVYLNGSMLDEKYINDPGQVTQGKFLREGQEVEVPSDSYIAMGDNRLHSSDSREWGFVTPQEIVGRAFFRYWPIPVFGVVSTTEAEMTLGAVKGAFTAK